ncbi:MAG: hypothetical protein AAF587_06515 [Bacteroidota bacterium]
MKQILLLLIASFSLSLSAQNALFIPFGQTMAEVDTFLQTKEYIHQITKPSADLIQVIVYEGRTMHYHFKDGFLFGIEEKRVYTNRKNKEEIVKNCLDFLKGTEEKIKTVKTEGVDSHYAVAPTDRVLEFMVSETGKRKNRTVNMTFKSTSRYHGPRLRTEEYASQILD